MKEWEQSAAAITDVAVDVDVDVDADDVGIDATEEEKADTPNSVVNSKNSVITPISITIVTDTCTASILLLFLFLILYLPPSSFFGTIIVVSVIVFGFSCRVNQKTCPFRLVVLFLYFGTRSISVQLCSVLFVMRCDVI